MNNNGGEKAREQHHAEIMKQMKREEEAKWDDLRASLGLPRSTDPEPPSVPSPQQLKELDNSLAARNAAEKLQPGLFHYWTQDVIGPALKACEAEGVQVEDIFGPKSKGMRAQKLKVENPERYAAIKREAIRRGILS